MITLDENDFSILDRFEKDFNGILLSLLTLIIVEKETRIWGYDLKQQLVKVTGNEITINNSTIYTILKTFENKYGLLKSEMEDRRRFYKLTDEGKANLPLINQYYQKMIGISLKSLKSVNYKIERPLEKLII